MTVDLDALEYNAALIGPLPLDREWTQAEKIRAHQICLHAPALIAEMREALRETRYALVNERDNPIALMAALALIDAALASKP